MCYTIFPDHSRHSPVKPRSSRTFRKSLRSSDTFPERFQLSPVKPKSFRKFRPSFRSSDTFPERSQLSPVTPKSFRKFRPSFRSSDTFPERSQLSPVTPKSFRKSCSSIGNRSVQRSRTSGERPGRESTDTRRGRGLHEAARSRVRKPPSTRTHLLLQPVPSTVCTG